jgi:chromosome segregation ATPase
MKKIITTVFIAVTTFSFAQEVKVKSGNEKFSSGSHDCLTTTIYEGDKDKAMTKWKSKLNDFKDEKVKWKGDEIFGDNILIKDWGNNTVDIYSKFDEDKEKKTVTMSVAVDLGGAYLTSSDKDKYNYIEKMMKEFAIDLTKDNIKDQVSAAEKIFSGLESDQKDLEKKNKGYKDDIEDYKKKISKAESDIKDNEAAQSKKKSEIDAQKKVVDDIKKKLDKVN